MTAKSLNVLIYGAGAVGATFGWRLAQNSHVRVTTICRSNYEAVFRDGFRMQSRMWGSGIFKPHRVVRDVDAVRNVAFDYIVCANKIIHSRDHSFVEGLRPVVRPQTSLVTAQNGFCVEPLLSQAFQDNTILSAVCYVSCVQKEPGYVHQVAAIRPSAFHIGSFSPFNPSSSDSLERLVELDPRFMAIANLTSERWTKLIFNGSWNPVAAIYRMTTEEIYSNPQALQHVQALADEIYAVAQAIGIRLPPRTPYQTTNCARDQPPITLSMLQDVRAGRQLEVEALCGSIVRQADQLGMTVPILRSTYRMLLRMNDALKSSTRTLIPADTRDEESQRRWSMSVIV